MNNRYDTIITGTGPAGLFCAINASSAGKKILILEKNSSAGKKLLLSGSGQCNFTHTGSIPEFLKHYGDTANFVKPALSAFTNIQLIEFFESHGIKTVARDDGKVFPASMKGEDILSLLLKLCRDNSVEIKYNAQVRSISHNGPEFILSAGSGIYTAEKFVIAAGGSSYPATGSSGDGFRLAASLGHSITEITPALTPLYIKDYTLGELSGISIKESRVTLARDDKKIISARGDILFTPKGLSGPGILDLSRYARSGDSITISLTDKSMQEIESLLPEALKNEGKKSIRNILKIFEMPERVIDALLAYASVDPLKKAGEISRAERSRIINLINAFPFEIKEKGDFRTAMATAGGVSRDEIDRKTMESKIVRGLYFAGEVIDVDGDTGGYNIQWAFSSGRAAGRSLL
jgi:hypothetical protein